MAHSGMPVPPLINLSHSIVAGGTFNQHNHISQNHYTRSGERPGYARLLENVATAALHDSVHVVDPPKCHPNTRVAVMQTIRDWTLGKTEELSGKPILWLKGGAGAGKSAIARSVAERCSEEDDPLIFGRSIRTQISALIIRPLSAVLAKRSTTSSATPCLIIIDGLDECSDINSQRDLLFTLHEVTSTTTLIRFLVCSRPESHLNNTFSLPHMVPILHKIFLDDDYSSWDDVRLYLADKFKQIKEGHSFKHLLPDLWPTPETVDGLVYKSSGQFIYAATVFRYIESPRHRPDERLNAILQLRPPFKDLPFTELDALYRFIISKAEDLPTVLDILAFLALYGEFKVRDIEAILQLGQGSVEVLLADLHSIIIIGRDGSMRFLHKSLEDFLAEPQRAGNLYQDLSRARLFHTARVISYFSTPKAQQDYKSGKTLTLVTSLPIHSILSTFDENPNIVKADFVSSDILEAVDLFPTVSFFVQLLRHDSHSKSLKLMLGFAQEYFQYLYFIKDVSESTKLVYSEQMRQYCKCILAVLDDDFSGNWKAHFLYAYYHLLQDPRHSLPKELFYFGLANPPTYDSCAECDFGEAICCIMELGLGRSLHSHDIITISHDLTEGIKQASIFAMSASYSLALLCDEQSSGRDWHLMSETSLFDPSTHTSVPWYTRKKVEKYLFLMDLLPHILPLAGRYGPLVDMCRNKSFSPHSQLWPKKSGRARDAIDSYLHRMDSQEEMEMEL